MLDLSFLGLGDSAGLADDLIDLSFLGLGDSADLADDLIDLSFLGLSDSAGLADDLTELYPSVCVSGVPTRIPLLVWSMTASARYRCPGALAN